MPGLDLLSKRKGMPVSMPFSPLTFTSFYQLTCLETPWSASNFSGVRRLQSALHRRHRWNVHRRRSAHARHHRSAHVRRRRSVRARRRRSLERNAIRRSWALRDIRRNCRHSYHGNIRHTTGCARSAAACLVADANRPIRHVTCHSSSRHNRYYRAGPRNPEQYRYNLAALRNSAPSGSSSCPRRPHYHRAPRRNWIRRAKPDCSKAA
jgi:hypothetical protein